MADTLWERVARALELAITSGEQGYKPGDTLPSENELITQYGYSRNTIRKALDSLADAGLITSSPGARRRVTARLLLNVHVTRTADRAVGGQLATRGADSWRADIEHLGHRADEQGPTVREGRAHEVAGRLGAAGDLVYVRELIRLVDNRPHNIARWYFPGTIARGTKLAHPRDIPGGSIPYLSGIGARPESYTVEIESRMPTRAEAGRLAIPSGVPLLVEYRTGFGAAGVPVFVEVSFWPSDRARLIMELES